jgi:hypothetical protein
MIRQKLDGWTINDSKGGVLTLNARVVNSSNIDVIGWPVSGESLMVVQFQDGSRYGYIGVPRQKAVACAYAKSCGKFLNERIKPYYVVAKLR